MSANDTQVLPAEMLLEIFDEPIVIPRAYVRLTGGLMPALFLATLAALTEDLGDQSNQSPDQRGWVFVTQAEWERLTSLSRYEQEAARRELSDRGFIAQIRRGLPARLGIRLEVQRVADALRRQAQATYGDFVAARRMADATPI